MKLDETIRVLASVKLLKNFEQDALRLIAFGAEARTITKGTLIYKQGSQSNGGTVIVKGEVEITQRNIENIILQQTTCSNGDILNQTGLIAVTECDNQAVANNTCEILQIPRPLFLRTMAEYPDMAQLLINRLGQSVQGFIEQLDDIGVALDKETAMYLHRKKSS